MLTAEITFQSAKDARDFIRSHPQGGRHLLQDLAITILELPEEERNQAWIEAAEQLQGERNLALRSK